MEKIKKCKKCELCLINKPVNGAGNPNADIMFIIDSPNYYDVKTGTLLGGKNGAMFDKLLNMINLNREDVYITALVKGKPTGNFIKVKNVSACSDYLRDELKFVKPKIIVTLGSKTLEFMLKKRMPISTFTNIALVAKDGTYIIPSYNINYVLHDVSNHSLAIRDFINIYKMYSTYVNVNIKQFEDKLHPIVRQALSLT